MCNCKYCNYLRSNPPIVEKPTMNKILQDLIEKLKAKKDQK